jgi:hypothetical protein
MKHYISCSEQHIHIWIARVTYTKLLVPLPDSIIPKYVTNIVFTLSTERGI